MADRSVSRKVIIEKSWRGIAYTGFREDLIAAGHLRAEWVRPKPYRNARLSTMLPDGREVRVYKKGDRLAVEHLFTEAEQESRHAREQALDAARQARASAEAEIAKWPTSKVDYSRRLERYSCMVLEGLRMFAMNGFGSYRVAPASMVGILEALEATVESLRVAEIAFDLAEREREETRLRSKAASHDPAFGAFLNRAMAPPAAQDGEGEHAHG
jgi:hypothetical protein